MRGGVGGFDRGQGNYGETYHNTDLPSGCP
jgi:hypothetical protein